MREPGDAPKEKLFTFRSAGWTLVLAALIIGLVLWQVGAHLVRVKSTRITDRFDRSTVLVPEETIEVVKSRDFVEAMTEPGATTVEEMETNPERWIRKLLVSTDRVIGLEVGGEARAYPLRILNWHEVVNDTLGGRPIAVTYHPLTDGAAVFDRRVGEETLELRVSGLLWQSGQILYDRRPAIGAESLWCQLQARAIAGPAAERGDRLTTIPFALVTFGEWTARHPATTVVRPDPVFYKHYPRNPYGGYYGTRSLRYRVHGYPFPGTEEEQWSGQDVPYGDGDLLRFHALRWAWQAIAGG